VTVCSKRWGVVHGLYDDAVDARAQILEEIDGFITRPEPERRIRLLK